MARLELAEVSEYLVDGELDRRAEEVFLALEIIIDQRGVDRRGAGDVLDRHRCEIALGEEIERGRREVAAAIQARRARRAGRPATGSRFLRLTGALHCKNSFVRSNHGPGFCTLGAGPLSVKRTAYTSISRAASEGPMPFIR